MVVEGTVMFVEEFKAGLERLGILFGEAEEIDAYGARVRTIIFRDVNVDLENRELQKALSEACESWKRLFEAFALEKLVSGGRLSIYDYVDVEEISWSRRHGPYVRLSVSSDARRLLQKYGLDGVDVREMEASLEMLLDREARTILLRASRPRSS
ncbi:MAG: hypothetical protein QXX87_02885 [Candidatus Jordarchaeales archaeon]